MKRLPSLLCLMTLAGIFFVALVQPAAAYPTKPIRLVIPWPPGGPTDMVGRPVARRLEEALGQPVVVDNRGGAGGTIGAEHVAKSPPDGQTLLVGGLSTHGISPSIHAKLGYDAIKDFAHITLLALVQNFLVVHPSMPVKNLKELVALARRHPGKLNYASVGVGSTSHLMTEMIESLSNMGAEAMGTTPEQTTEFVRREIAVWAKAVKEAGVKAD